MHLKNQYKIHSKYTGNSKLSDLTSFSAFFSKPCRKEITKQNSFIVSDDDLQILIQNVKEALESLLMKETVPHSYLPPNEVTGEVFGEKRTFNLRNEVEDQIFWLSSFYNFLQRDNNFYFEYVPLH